MLLLVLLLSVFAIVVVIIIDVVVSVAVSWQRERSYRISLSDPYSTSMPNFKCQNNLKDPKHAVERQATFYSLSFSKYNKRGMGGVSKKQLKKNGLALRLHALYSLPLAESLPLQRIE